MYTKATHCNQFIENDFDIFDTINTHILFGRSGFKLNRISFEKRLPLFKLVIDKSKKLALKRIIISDYHAEAQNTEGKCQFKLVHLKPKSVLIETAKELLFPEFEITNIVYSAGEGCPNRDIHIIADRT